MSATAVKKYAPAYLRDLRHMEARAAGVLADWLVHLDLQGKAPRTLYQYVRQVAPLLRANPDLDYSEFTAAHINEALAAVPRQSRHITRSIYNQWFTWGYRQELLDRNPMDKVPTMRARKGRPRDIYSEAEQAQLQALPSPDGPLFALLFGSGLRRAEARNLRWEHILLDRGRLIVHDGKGQKGGIVPLLPDALTALADLALLEGLRPADHLWYTRRGNRRLRRDPGAATGGASDAWGEFRSDQPNRKWPSYRDWKSGTASSIEHITTGEAMDD